MFDFIDSTIPNVDSNISSFLRNFTNNNITNGNPITFENLYKEIFRNVYTSSDDYEIMNFQHVVLMSPKAEYNTIWIDSSLQ